MNLAFILTPKSRTAFIYEDSTFRQALEKLRHHGFAAIPVLSRDGGYVGTLTEGDFLWSMLEIGGASLADCEKLHVSEIIKKRGRNPAVGITSNDSDLLQRAMEQNFVPIVDDRGSFMGIVTRRAIIEQLIKERSND